MKAAAYLVVPFSVLCRLPLNMLLADRSTCGIAGKACFCRWKPFDFLLRNKRAAHVSSKARKDMYKRAQVVLYNEVNMLQCRPYNEKSRWVKKEV